MVLVFRVEACVWWDMLWSSLCGMDGSVPVLPCMVRQRLSVEVEACACHPFRVWPVDYRIPVSSEAAARGAG